MALEDLVMPKLGESIMEATILKWLKQVGDKVEMDETVLEIATDKVDSEVPSTAAGIIESILFNENDVVPIGTVIARIRTEEDGSHETPLPPAHEPAAAPVTAEKEQEAEVVSSEIKNGEVNSNPAAPNKFYSPLVLNIAANEGISMSELEKIPGTGKEGRVTKNDILGYIASRAKKGTDLQSASTASNVSVPSIAHHDVQPTAADWNRQDGAIEIIEMDRMRKLIAEHMVRSKHTSPHVTSFSEADVTNMVIWREKVKKDFEKREGTKITFTPLFIEAITKCIKRFPLVNSSVEGDKILIRKDINIGMATALPNGNLIVPVIKNADQLNLTGLAKRVNGLADAARNNKLKAEDTQGGTFTLTNVGSFGSLAGTPIINQPQVAILAVGAIKKRPVVIETPQGDSIAIRHMMVLSLSYDHRIVDGALGATFLTAVAKELESFKGTEF
ncbi:diapophytoene dehydrogenase [Niabella ginsenosidivorans]|uniref:Dihydrolipoamide acetyltransferase component of pyruvate dehydrogenase complex n=1 Tax=Niabella ginsenosidivorans TaxID=1176587 RepID=A0A1A9I3B7_9BACT|nr:dihydrolipoamide acetyltransferase family protein [Niabella ginsenosidivorans]ANH81549.1 diapophytoene dehydrogenase [Niabella ginsenosidivorans]